MAEMDLPWLHQVVRELSKDFPSLILHNTSPAKESIVNEIIWAEGCKDYYWIILKWGDISLDSSLHVTGSHQGSSKVDVSINEVGLQSDRVSIVVQRLLQLTTLLEHIAQVGVRLGQHGVLLDGQGGEVGWLFISPTLKMNGGQEEQDSGVGGILSPQLHRVLLCILIIPRLQ